MNYYYKLLITFSIVGFTACLDQVSKLYIHTQMKVGDSITIIEGFFDITYARNPGGVFGFFSDGSENIRYILFIILPIFCVAFLFKILQTVERKIEVIGLSFILGGAVGNYIDRIRFEYVVDFINWHIKDFFYWPIFNIADSFIVIGVFIMLYFSFGNKTVK